MSTSSVVSRIAHEQNRHSPSIMPKAPWWNNLETNFHQRPEGFDLELADLIPIRATAAFDVALRTFASTVAAPFVFAQGYRPAALERMAPERAFYAGLADRQDPSCFFADPPPEVEVETSKPRGYHMKPRSGTCEELSFASPFEPTYEPVRESYLAESANRRTSARYWRHERDGPRPTIMVLHGFGAERVWINEWLFSLPWFYRIGCDVLLVTMPFHGPRQTPRSLFSGYGFFAEGVSRMNEAFAQAVLECRIFLEYLQRERGVERVGVTGVSLGGYTTALLAAVEKRFAFAVPNVPVASLADLTLEWNPLGGMVRAGLMLNGESIKEFRHSLAVHCPLTYPSLIPTERLMIIGGVGDRFAPPKHARLLWDHWGRCRIHWFPGSHILHLDQGDYRRKMLRFLNEIDFVEPRTRDVAVA